MAARRSRPLKIVDPDEVVPKEVLADAIVKLSDAAERLLSGRLTERALLLLLHDAVKPTTNWSGKQPTKPTKSDIKAVLHALPELKKLYVKGTRK